MYHFLHANPKSTCKIIDHVIDFGERDEPTAQTELSSSKLVNPFIILVKLTLHPVRHAVLDDHISARPAFRDAAKPSVKGSRQYTCADELRQ